MRVFVPFCSARLQAGMVDSRTCPSEGERYSPYPKISLTFSNSEESR